MVNRMNKKLVQVYLDLPEYAWLQEKEAEGFKRSSYLRVLVKREMARK